MKSSYPFKRAVIDTMIPIYLFEDHPQFGKPCEGVFNSIAAGSFQGILTPITIAEIVVKPYSQKRSDIADRYRYSLTTFSNLSLCAISSKTALLAGALRAKYGRPLSDLFQIACAIEHDAALITNDKALKVITEIPVIQLDTLFQ